ncbi:hypothetical protein P7C70_g1362, partial [Phenoliferia sp. Uapishka_3]
MSFIFSTLAAVFGRQSSKSSNSSDTSSLSEGASWITRSLSSYAESFESVASTPSIISYTTSRPSPPSATLSSATAVGVVSPPSLADKMRAVLPPPPPTVVSLDWRDALDDVPTQCSVHEDMHLRHNLRSYLRPSQRTRPVYPCTCHTWRELEEDEVDVDEAYCADLELSVSGDGEDVALIKRLREAHDDKKLTGVWVRTGGDKLRVKRSSSHAVLGLAKIARS